MEEIWLRTNVLEHGRSLDQHIHQFHEVGKERAIDPASFVHSYVPHHREHTIKKTNSIAKYP